MKAERVIANQENLLQAKHRLVLHEDYHNWDITEALKYFMYFVPEGLQVRARYVDDILSDLDVGWKYHQITSVFGQLAIDGVLINERVKCQDDGYIHHCYRFQRQARQEFFKEKSSKGELIEESNQVEPELTSTSQSLTQLIPEISDENERVFAIEAEKCLSADALRAAVVMSWNLAFAHLRRWIFQKNLAEFNNVLTAKWLSKAKSLKLAPIVNLEDFDDHRERFIIEIANEAKLLTKDEHQSLCHGIEKRNKYAHPNDTKIEPAIAAGHVSDLIVHVVSNPNFSP